MPQDPAPQVSLLNVGKPLPVRNAHHRAIHLRLSLVRVDEGKSMSCLDGGLDRVFGHRQSRILPVSHDDDGAKHEPSVLHLLDPFAGGPGRPVGRHFHHDACLLSYRARWGSSRDILSIHARPCAASEGILEGDAPCLASGGCQPWPISSFYCFATVPAVGADPARWTRRVT